MSDVIAPAVEEYDHLLNHLVDLANTAGLQCGITLNVGGSVVSGTLISGDKFFDIFASRFGQMFDPGESADTVVESFKAMGKVYEDSRLPEAPPREKPYAYIHLDDARTFTSSTPLTVNASIWRGRLSEIAGWNFGSITVTKT